MSSFRQVVGGTVPPPQDPVVAHALEAASQRYGVPLSLLSSVAYHESRYSPTAVSPKGARGLMQLMPATATRLGVTEPFNPAQSADGGAKLLSDWYRKYNDYAAALAAYVWGPGNVDRARRNDTAEWPDAVYTYVTRVLEGAGMPVPFSYRLATPDGVVVV